MVEGSILGDMKIVLSFSADYKIGKVEASLGARSVYPLLSVNGSPSNGTDL